MIDRTPAEPVTVPDDLTGHPYVADLRRFAEAMETVRTAVDPKGYGVLCDDRTFTCDGGAAVAALAAERLRLPYDLCVGLYWHTDPAIRADLMGEDPDDPDTLAWIERDAMDEHHHWIVLWPYTDHTVVFDPNGPIRDEDYFQPARQPDGSEVYIDDPDGPRVTYSRFWNSDPDAHLAYDPDDYPETILTEGYGASGQQTVDLLAQLVPLGRQPLQSTA